MERGQSEIAVQRQSPIEGFRGGSSLAPASTNELRCAECHNRRPINIAAAQFGGKRGPGKNEVHCLVSAISVEGVLGDTRLQLPQNVFAGHVATPFAFSCHRGPVEQFTGNVYVIVTRPDFPDRLGDRWQPLAGIKPDPLAANDFEPLAHVCV